MKTLRKKLRIESATAFKLEYYIGGSDLKIKEFSTYKTMEQFHNRQKAFNYLDCNRYALINDTWHRFIKLKSPIVFEQDLSFINQTFNEVIDEKNLHKYKIEE